ncbi:zinc metallochaperone AztD [Halomonas sp. GT]|uniref:zinc metallochaperone AztD n=1 Tax=Halomonas sp. GT TaxID=1971364 RepID=UPI0009F48ECE|nr:zinc metallochaperone AztD [Halomonas sp. GT]
MPPMFIGKALTALAFAISSAAVQAHDHSDDHAHGDGENVTAWRLLVADQQDAVVHVIDAKEKSLLDTFEIAGPAALHRSRSGEAVFAVQGAANTVSVINTGIAFHDHGDHADIEVSAPALLDVTLEGERPAHFVERQGYIAQWFDGEDEARLFTESSTLSGEPDIRVANVEAPHHGVAVPYHSHAVVTVVNPEDSSQRPIGAKVLDSDGNLVGGEVACPGLHGSAGSGSLYALACHTGLLLIATENGTPQITHLPYPNSLPEGSASTLLGGIGLQYFMGNYGPDRLILVDPTEGGEGFQLVQLPTRRVHFAVDPIRARYAYVFTEDGQLHQLDVLNGELTQSLRLTEPYSMDGHWNEPRPRIAVAGDQVVVTDPNAEALHFIDIETFEQLEEMPLEGKPYNIVAVGGTGVSHNN